MADMRLIDANALDLEPDQHNAMNGVRFSGRRCGRTVAMVQSALKHMIDNAPTVDAVPVVHGYWIANNICSVCREGIKGWAIQSGYKFCPNCGAKMDGVMADG